ncbi:MAG TPA: NrdJb, partial [Chromatiales bacterium]|nr:NrdJb [Chromatiales bacterium]
MAIKIDSTIVGYEVVSEDEDDQAAEAALKATEQEESNVIQMHERLERPEMLLGSTYKVKTPLSEHALYITINDVILNQGTENELRRPFEIFINSKNMDHFQWIVALTRIVSAVFRKGGDVTFLVEELRSVFDPRGGYFKKGGKYMPSLVAEIGDAIECHLRMIGMLADDGLDEHQKKLVEEKRAQFEGSIKQAEASASNDSEFPASAQLCAKCSTKAVIKMDGCMTCLNCG